MDAVLGVGDGFYGQFMEASKSAHYYSMVWNVYPLTSVLEVMILRNQVERLCRLLEVAIGHWMARAYEASDALATIEG